MLEILKKLKNNIGSSEKEWKKIDILINNAGLARGSQKYMKEILKNGKK